MKNYYVYIVTNQPRGTLYIGVTNNLQRRIMEHKAGAVDGFTKKYGLKKLVFVEQYTYIHDALTLEKRLKLWRREWKISLVEEKNPSWDDLFEKYFNETQ